MRDNDHTPGKGRILNRRQVSEFFSIAPTTVDRWVARGCPTRKRATGRGSGSGTWEFVAAEVVAWRIAEMAGNVARDAIRMDLAEARRRRAAAEASLAELLLAERRGSLVALADIERVWCRIVGVFRSHALALPSRFAPQLAILSDQATIHALLTEGMHAMLSELSSDQSIEAAVLEAESAVAEAHQGNGGDSANGADRREARCGARAPIA